MTPASHKRLYVELALFTCGAVAVLFMLALPNGTVWIRDLGQIGYPSALFGGFLYGVSATAGLATVMIAELPDRLSPIVIALLGGIGAATYDLIIFSLSRDGSNISLISRFRVWMQTRSPRTRWSSVILGCLVLASPLPDELGAALLGGATTLRKRTFWWVSALLNMTGILIITIIGHG